MPITVWKPRYSDRVYIAAPTTAHTFLRSQFNAELHPLSGLVTVDASVFDTVSDALSARYGDVRKVLDYDQPMPCGSKCRSCVYHTNNAEVLRFMAAQGYVVDQYGYRFIGTSSTPLPEFGEMVDLMSSRV